MDADAGAPLPKAAARGLLKGWLAAKILPFVARIVSLLLWFGSFAMYASLVWWSVKRRLRAGALDEAGAPDGAQPSTVVREHGVLAWVRDPDAAG
jgi:uncharacterized membrane protein